MNKIIVKLFILKNYMKILFFLIAISLYYSSSSSSMLLKRILVTGGNKGIGNAICKKILSSYPDTYVILGARDITRGNEGIQNIIDSLGEEINSRIEILLIDVSNQQSVDIAADSLKSKYGESGLYAIVNNAGVYAMSSLSETLETNYYGPRRVNKAFIPLINKDIGRIVNVSSASGPIYVSHLTPDKQQLFLDPKATFEALEERIKEDSMIVKNDGSKCYGLSKALLNAYTIQLAQEYPKLKINSCTPGFILTDLTRNMGVYPTNLPEQGTISTLFLLFDEDNVSTGMYYGSDAIRSPLNNYRGPGDPPYNP